MTKYLNFLSTFYRWFFCVLFLASLCVASKVKNRKTASTKNSTFSLLKGQQTLSKIYQETDLLEAIKVPFESSAIRYVTGYDGFPAFGLSERADIKRPYRLILPERLYRDFSILATFKSNSMDGGFLFSVVNPSDTLIQLGLRVGGGAHRSNVTVFYTKPVEVVSHVLATFVIPSTLKQWTRLALKVQGDNVTLYVNCNVNGTVTIRRKRLPKELVFDTASTLYIGQAGPLLKGRFQVTFRSIGKMEPQVGVKNSVFKFLFSDEYYFGLFFQIQNYFDFSKWYNRLMPRIGDVIADTYTDPFMANLISDNLTTKFDVALLDVHGFELYMPVVQHLRIPTVLISTYTFQALHADKVQAPYHFFNNVFGFPGIPPNRLSAFCINSLVTFWASNTLVSEINRLFPVFFPWAPSFTEMLKSVSMLMSANSYATQDAMPGTPNVHHIGCAQCREAQSLPESLEKLLNDSTEHGAIYFTMGSIVASDQMPEEFLSKVISVLRQLNKTIIFKGQLDFDTSNLTNFHFREWIPQQDLLGHPNVRLVITHGGLGTVQEAAYHGCPILGFPLSVDHNYNIRHALQNGLAEQLDWRTFDEEQLLLTINYMINDSRYKQRALLASKRMRDVLMSPTEEAVYWTEYVTRHKGARFLKNQAYNLRWFEYFMCDVIIVLVSIATLAIALLWLTLRATVNTMRRSMKMY